jgi:prevent-host-death family protein
MVRQVTLRDANQNFARYVRAVSQGEEFVITRRGEPVARLVPARPAVRRLTPEQVEALARTRRLAAKGYTMGGAPFDRDEAHER